MNTLSVLIFNGNNDFTKGFLSETFGYDSKMTKKPEVKIIDSDECFGEWVQENCTDIGTNLTIEGGDWTNPSTLKTMNATKYDRIYVVMLNGICDVSSGFFDCVDYFEEKKCIEKVHVVAPSLKIAKQITRKTKVLPENMHIPIDKVGRRAAWAAAINAIKTGEIMPGIEFVQHVIPKQLQKIALRNTVDQVSSKGVMVVLIIKPNGERIVSPSGSDVLEGIFVVVGEHDKLTEFFNKF